MSTRPAIRAIIVLLLVAAAIVALPAVVRAQGARPPTMAPDVQPEEAVATAPVVVDGVALFRVRGISTFPAEARAHAVATRIVTAATNPAFRPDRLRLDETEPATRILADQALIVGVYDADSQVEGVPRQVLAAAIMDRVRAAITAYRDDRSGPAMQRAMGRAAAATALAVVLLTAVFWLWRRIDTLVDARYRRRVEALTAMSHDVVSAAAVWTSIRNGLRLVRSALLLMLAYVLLQYVLALFPQTRLIARSLGQWVLDPIATMWASFTATIPSLLFLAVLFVLVRFLLKLIHRFFDAVDKGRVVFHHFEREWAIPTYKLVRLLVVAFAIVVGYPYIPGSSSEAFKGISLFLGIVFSLGSSSFLANMIAGYSMNYRRLFKVGDRVKIGEVNGEVTAVRLQVTHVRTIRNEEVTVPNSVILNTSVVNYSALARSKGLVLLTQVGIGYETPWRQVEAMLLEAATRTPGLVPGLAPFVRQQALGDFAVTYALCVHTDEPLRMEAIYTDLHRHVLDVFNEYGVQIMTPAYEGDPAVPKIVPRDQWYTAPAAPATSATPDEGSGFSRTQNGAG